MSCPAQNALPAPVTTTPRIAGSAASSLRTRWSSVCNSRVKALYASGRLRVIVSTAPSRPVSTVGMAGRLTEPGRVLGRERQRAAHSRLDGRCPPAGGGGEDRARNVDHVARKLTGRAVRHPGGDGLREVLEPDPPCVSGAARRHRHLLPRLSPQT